VIIIISLVADLGINMTTAVHAGPVTAKNSIPSTGHLHTSFVFHTLFLGHMYIGERQSVYIG